MQDLTLAALQQLCNKHLIGSIAVLWIYCTLGAILQRQTMQSFIETARNNFNQTSRLVKFFRNIRLQGQAPKWLQPHHELTQIFKEQKDLLEHGTVVWGCIVQANNLLFSHGFEDFPAMVVFSLDPFFDKHSSNLATISNLLYRLKNSSPDDPAQARFASMITNERQSAFNWQVPNELTENRLVVSSTIIVFRKHLPNQILDSKLLPLLINPLTGTAMILPYQYWPQQPLN